MTYTLTTAVAIGIIIGWNLPQPKYAKLLQDWIVSKIKNLISK